LHTFLPRIFRTGLVLAVSELGLELGLSVGPDEGSELGVELGLIVGPVEGTVLGVELGLSVGPEEGSALGVVSTLCGVHRDGRRLSHNGDEILYELLSKQKELEALEKSVQPGHLRRRFANWKF
jgi:hypothetical protein